MHQPYLADALVRAATDRARCVPGYPFGHGTLGANHGALSYGHIGADMITLASLLRIAVCMHNPEEAALFRPSAWNAFGTDDLTSADYRACSTFGPLDG